MVQRQTALNTKSKAQSASAQLMQHHKRRQTASVRSHQPPLPFASSRFPSPLLEMSDHPRARAVAPIQKEEAQEDNKRSIPEPIKLNPIQAKGLPETMKSNMEAMGGVDLSDVRVHRNSPAPAQIGALAYAQGNNIHLGPGQEKYLGHEA